MTRKSQSNPLHDYEIEAGAANPERLQRLMILKQAIARGQYHDEDLFNCLLENMCRSMSQADDPDAT